MAHKIFISCQTGIGPNHFALQFRLYQSCVRIKKVSCQEIERKGEIAMKSNLNYKGSWINSFLHLKHKIWTLSFLFAFKVIRRCVPALLNLVCYFCRWWQHYLLLLSMMMRRFRKTVPDLCTKQLIDIERSDSDNYPQFQSQPSLEIGCVIFVRTFNG